MLCWSVSKGMLGLTTASLSVGEDCAVIPLQDTLGHKGKQPDNSSDKPPPGRTRCRCRWPRWWSRCRRHRRRWSPWAPRSAGGRVRCQATPEVFWLFIYQAFWVSFYKWLETLPYVLASLMISGNVWMMSKFKMIFSWWLQQLGVKALDSDILS